jgi:O-antigen ligase
VDTLRLPAVRSVQAYMLYALVGSACLLGGGQTDFGVAWSIQLLIAAILLGLLIVLERDSQNRTDRGAYIWLSLLLLLPLVQLVPMPVTTLGTAPGRELAASARALAETSPGWHPLSLSPSDTWLAFFSFCMIAVAFAASWMASAAQRRVLIKIFVAFAFATIGVGVFQVAGGGRVFDFHNSGHRNNLIGFFANRNHAALYLAAMMPFWAHLVITSRRRLSSRSLIILGGVVALAIGIIGTTSRAGIILGAIGVLVVLIALAGNAQRKPSWRWVFAGVAGLAGVSALVGSTRRFSDVIARFDLVGTDLRWGIWSQSWKVAQSYLPFGSGFGSFRTVFDPMEPLTSLTPQYVNNAHNDYIEVVIEAGLPGAALLFAGLVICVWQYWQVRKYSTERWLSSTEGPASVFLAMVALHSLVDYPMRRMAIAVPLAVVLAFMFNAKSSTSKFH